MKKGATISECGIFRYSLWRLWDEKPIVLFIMLNPSTADGDFDDPTIRRLIGFCQRWGTGGFYVGNLYPYRTSSPAILNEWWGSFDNWHEMIDANKENQCLVKEMAIKASYCVIAWGANGMSKGLRTSEEYRYVTGELQLFCLGVTKAGFPRHPLYVPYDSPLITWPECEKTENPLA
ncbi:DUF1643 domain-containing protein [Chitinophaga niabensis]|uniref:DUF1643 domain-containing protein n=1 Tax=Chitinophaga niabensis TaxID=536979 RepID=UPI0031BAF4A5